MMIKHFARSQEGWSLVIAMMLMGVMMSLGLAAFAMVDTQTSQSRKQRERDSSFNVAEGVLYAQGFALARNWPSRGQSPYPEVCTNASTDARCASAALIAGANPTGGANFTNVDQQVGAVWTIKIRDNGGTLGQTYDPVAAEAQQNNGGLGVCPATEDDPCAQDANDDHALWVNAQATVRGRKRNLVALMRLEELQEDVPVAAVTAGSLGITLNGNQTVIQANGGDVNVRCQPESPGTVSGNPAVCSNTEPGQVSPPPARSTVGDLMTTDQLIRFRDRARIDGRFYSGCPTPDATGKIDLSGDVVWVEGCATAPQYSTNIKTEPCDPPAPSLGGTQQLSGSCINQNGDPGVLIWHCGAVQMTGGFTFAGLIYMVNNSSPELPCTTPPGTLGDGTCQGSNFDAARDVLFTSGGFGLWGALAVDGPGCLKMRANGFQVFYDANVFGEVKSYGTVGVEQSTWRELPPTG